MTTHLHAHISTASADCDGPMYREWVAGFNDTETAEHVAANGINDFSDIHFMNRIFTNQCGPYAIHQMRITADDSGFEYHESTEEGYRSGEVRWCHDEDCDPNAYSQRDVYAEMMGY